MAGLTSLIPVILLLLFVGGFAYVGYQMYLYSTELATRGQNHLHKRNIHFSADGGLKVGVKELRPEDYADKQQNLFVKAWNYSSWPEYRSRFWNKDAQPALAARAGGAKAPVAKPAPVKPVAARR